MANPDRLIQERYPGLEKLKSKIETEDPEFNIHVRFPVEQIIEILDALLLKPEIINHPRRDYYEKSITEDITNLLQIEEKARNHVLTEVKPSNPYLSLEGNGPLSSIALSSLNNETEPERNKHFLLTDMMFSALGVWLPERWQTIKGFLTEEDRSKEPIKGTSARVNVTTSWTFPTIIPGVAIYVLHFYPRLGQQPLTMPTNFHLAFKPEVFSKQ